MVMVMGFLSSIEIINKRILVMTQAQLRRFFLTHTHWIAGIAFIIIAIAFGGFAVATVAYIGEMKDKLTDQMTQNERHIDHLKAGISQDNVRRRNIIATEQLIASVNPKLKYDARLEYATYFIDAIENMPGVDLSLALAVATSESKFIPNAVSYIEIGGVPRVNAVGVFQIVSETGDFIATKMGIPYDGSLRYDPRLNIKMGVWYIQYLLNKYKNEEQALAHYLNGTSGAVGWGALRKYGSDAEYNKLSREDIVSELGIPSTDSIKTYRLNSYLAAKELKTQTIKGVPGIMLLKRQYIEYFRKADVYLTPTNTDVIDTTGKK